MPANLTPQYHEAEARFRRATEPQEKLAALEDMSALIPKHKGTEKMVADIRKKISQVRQELQQKKGPKRQDPSSIPQEGAGRVVLAGPPNGGKSSLLKALTNAEPEIGPWPFTTREPAQGMAPWEDIQFQLIDLPALSREHMEPWVMNLVRSAGLLLLVVDHTSPGVLEEIGETEAILAGYKVFVRPPAGEAERGGLVVSTLLLLNKIDLPGGEDNAGVVREFYGDRFEILPVAAETGAGLETLRRLFFERLNIVRVYTKLPGKPAEMDRPYVLPQGSTLLDLCRMVHQDFAEHLNFARVWGAHTFDGQRVNRDYVLADRDVVELHR